MSRARLLVLLSGGGRTMVNLADRIDAGSLDAEIAGVVASRECPGAEKARARGFGTRVLPGDIPPGTIDSLLRETRADFIVLAGYLRLVAIPPGREHTFVNIHPALLPSFGGRGMYGDRVHRAVLEAGCKVTGCTVHLCDAVYDRGPIVAQRCCPVLEADTVGSLADRVFAVENELYPEALGLLIAGRVRIEGGRARIV